MLVSEIMTTPLSLATESQSLSSVAQTMRELDVGALPVASDNGIHGVVTDRDIVIRGVANGKEVNSTPVRDIMTPQTVTCRDDSPVESAAELMKTNKIRRLVITDKENNAVGMLALADIARSQDKARGGEVLETVSKPTS